MDSDLKEIERSLERVERHARSRDYSGYCKFDALNSPILEKVCGSSYWMRLLALQAVNRIPLPLRSWFGVVPARNPKGIANFIRGYALLGDRETVIGLSDWLLSAQSREKSGAWGYPFPWQSPGFYAPRHDPNCIVTTFCAEALLAAYQLTKMERFLEGAREAARYITHSLPVLESSSETLCIGYVEGPLRWKVININAVVGGFLAKLAKETGNSEWMESASRMIRWVLGARETSEACWSYTFPESQSRIGPDNYHTGGILDGISDYMEASGDRSAERLFRDALAFYSERFFTKEGAPKWRIHRPYPMDIHGAAQGILTFSRSVEGRYRTQALEIAEWAIRVMQDPDQGYFYYQKYRSFRWKIDLMRWNNSWMFWALSQLRSSLLARGKS